jgi:hypothetical protein
VSARGRSALVALFVALLAVVGSIPPSAAEAPRSRSVAFEPHADPYGQTMEAWSQEWWRWTMGAPFAINPSLDSTGANCAVDQPGGHVWFLGTTFEGGDAVRSCAVPEHSALLVNLSGALNDYPCPDPSFEPAPGQSLEDFLAEGAKAATDAVDALTLTVDGVEVPALFSYRVATHLFEFAGDISMQGLDPCVTGESQPAVSDGFMVMVMPLSAGEHTLVYTSHNIFGRAGSVAYNLEVVS